MPDVVFVTTMLRVPNDEEARNPLVMVDVFADSKSAMTNAAEMVDDNFEHNSPIYQTADETRIFSASVYRESDDSTVWVTVDLRRVWT